MWYCLVRLTSASRVTTMSHQPRFSVISCHLSTRRPRCRRETARCRCNFPRWRLPPSWIWSNRK